MKIVSKDNNRENADIFGTAIRGVLIVRPLLFLLALVIGVAQASQEPQEAPRVETQQTNTPPTSQNSDAQSATTKPASTTAVSIVPNTELGKHTGNGSDEGTEFWPSLLGYRLKVTDTLLVGFTALLFAATVFLYRATRDLVISAEDTSKKELRAYVGVYQISVADFECGQPSAIQIHATNYGKTPAHNTAITGAIDIFPWPLPEAHKLSEIPSPGAPSVLFPTAQLDFPTRPTREFTPAELDAACEGKTKRFYSFGVVTYIDAFTEPCETHFCVSLSGGENLIKLRNGGKPDGLRFEIAHQHNSAT